MGRNARTHTAAHTGLSKNVGASKSARLQRSRWQRSRRKTRMSVATRSWGDAALSMRWQNHTSRCYNRAHGWQQTSHEPLASNNACAKFGTTHVLDILAAQEQQRGGKLRMQRAKRQHASRPWRYTPVNIRMHVHTLSVQVHTRMRALVHAAAAHKSSMQARTRTQASYLFLAHTVLPTRAGSLVRGGRLAQTARKSTSTRDN